MAITKQPLAAVHLLDGAFTRITLTDWYHVAAVSSTLNVYSLCWPNHLDPYLHMNKAAKELNVAPSTITLAFKDLGLKSLWLTEETARKVKQELDRQAKEEADLIAKSSKKSKCGAIKCPFPRLCRTSFGYLWQLH